MGAGVVAYAVVCIVALLVSGLTLFSGFGLGTLLMPAFALFFPLEVAIAATAVVHLSNNLFKLGLLSRHTDWGRQRGLGFRAPSWRLQGRQSLTSSLACLP